jgi:DNA-directed RNA polymerase specialized sigma24 family protein
VLMPPDGWSWQQVIRYAEKVVARTLERPEHRQDAAWVANEAAYLAVKRFEGRCPWRGYLRKVSRFRALYHAHGSRRRGFNVRCGPLAAVPAVIEVDEVKPEHLTHEPDPTADLVRAELLAAMKPRTRAVVLAIENGERWEDAARQVGYANGASIAKELRNARAVASAYGRASA